MQLVYKVLFHACLLKKEKQICIKHKDYIRILFLNNFPLQKQSMCRQFKYYKEIEGQSKFSGPKRPQKEFNATKSQVTIYE